MVSGLCRQYPVGHGHLRIPRIRENGGQSGGFNPSRPLEYMRNRVPLDHRRNYTRGKPVHAIRIRSEKLANCRGADILCFAGRKRCEPRHAKRRPLENHRQICPHAHSRRYGYPHERDLRGGGALSLGMMGAENITLSNVERPLP